MKRFVKIILLLLVPLFVSAQSQEKQLDSLYLALKNTTNDTIRMNVYWQLGLFYNEINRDSAIFYLDKGIPIAQKLKLKIIEAHMLENRGFMLSSIGNYPKALESFLLALKIAEDPASEKNVWNLPEGQTPLNARLQVLGFIHLTMGHLYGRTNNTDKQIASYFQAIRIAESIQHIGLKAMTNMNLGRVYIGLNKLDSALLIEQTALDLKGKYGGGVLSNIGLIYQKKGNFELALDAYQKSLKANLQQNNLSDLTGNYISLGSLYHILNKPDSSLYYGRKALETAKIVNSPIRMANAYQLLSDVCSDQKNKDSAFVWLKLAASLSDSLNNVERKNLLDYQSLSFDEQMRLKALEEEKASFQNKIRTNTLLGGLFTLLVIAFFLYRNNRQKQIANIKLNAQKEEIQTTLEQLKSTQSQLIQSEKMASLGELTAGIAHEIQNPLNFVNNFSEVSNELVDEMNEELDKGDLEEAKAIAGDIKQNLKKINHHGKRAESIVKGMLLHSRGSSGQKELTDINALCDEYLRLSYHGLRAKDKSFNAEFKFEADESLPKIEVVPQDIGRVLLNLINNAFYVVNEKAKQNIEGYKPEVIVRTAMNIPPSGRPKGVRITVKDNGPGIPDSVKDKIFQPFFTTKPTGQGTGLGLSLSYDIVKAHGGEIKVKSTEWEGTEFIILISIKN